ncbi:protein tyrosine phosphatase [Pedobacter frigiditerrae]|uniref:Protein tyrosine phosphatase n=1 Tax=Pedobacter frigiditerrae TaxID=2530452 RepID=A0A4R0N670_9SPHI|nr:protein tyrosine phosphatase [Pedobacter frigiditerrae]TCC94122.1 protein tyrosine phosphatase [Pedobacter frigiditerrae]
MNVLFVCSRNKWRSATAETIYQNHPIHQVRSAGTAASARIKINAKMINWADLIFVMEKRHKQILNESFSAALEEKEMIILDIPDDYQYMDEELIIEIETKVSPYL